MNIPKSSDAPDRNGIAQGDAPSKFHHEAYHVPPSHDAHPAAPKGSYLRPVALNKLNENEPLKPGCNYIVNKFMVDGQQRQLEFHVPKGYDGKHPLPIVYVMPGFNGSMAQMAGETNLDHYADKKHFIAAYLQALPKKDAMLGQSIPSWNLKHGSVTGHYDPKHNDLDYIKAGMKFIEGKLNVDHNRRYLYGFSEGGSAEQYVSEKMPHTFAGIGVVHGTYLKGDPKPQPGDAPAVVVIASNEDHAFPTSGGRGAMTIALPRVAGSEPLKQAPIWAGADNCTDPKTTDNGRDKITTWTCPAGKSVTQITHEGYGPLKQLAMVPLRAVEYLMGVVPYSKLAHAKWGGQHAIDDGEGPDGLNAQGRNAGMLDHGHGGIFATLDLGAPDPTENDTRTIVNTLLRYKR